MGIYIWCGLNLRVYFCVCKLHADEQLWPHGTVFQLFELTIRKVTGNDLNVWSKIGHIYWKYAIYEFNGWFHAQYE